MPEPFERQGDHRTGSAEWWAETKRLRELDRTLLDRLLAGDELHREAAAKIMALKTEVREWAREAQNEPQRAYSEGRLDGMAEAASRERGW